MGIEDALMRTTKDVTTKGVNLIETGIKKAWSIMDAASEKKGPSEILSSNAVSSIQGKISE